MMAVTLAVSKAELAVTLELLTLVERVGSSPVNTVSHVTVPLATVPVLVHPVAASGR